MTEVLGVKIDNLTTDEALERIGNFLNSDRPRIRTPHESKLHTGQASSVRGRQHYIVLLYSEFIVRAQKDEEFRKILNKADLSLCESRGLYLIAKILGKKIKTNIYGVDLIYNIVRKSEIQNPKSKIFLLGGKEDVVQKTAKKLGDNIVGAEHGYRDLDRVIEKINKAKPDILLVGLGSPKQEKWIYENLAKMPSVKLAIGVGGAFDFISSRVKRAPKFFQKIGLEWLWRLINQPRRAKRIYNGVVGLSRLVLKEKFLALREKT